MPEVCPNCSSDRHGCRARGPPAAGRPGLPLPLRRRPDGRPAQRVPAAVLPGPRRGLRARGRRRLDRPVARGRRIWDVSRNRSCGPRSTACGGLAAGARSRTWHRRAVEVVAPLRPPSTSPTRGCGCCWTGTRPTPAPTRAARRLRSRSSRIWSRPSAPGTSRAACDSSLRRSRLRAVRARRDGPHRRTGHRDPLGRRQGTGSPRGRSPSAARYRRREFRRARTSTGDLLQPPPRRGARGQLAGAVRRCPASCCCSPSPPTWRTTPCSSARRLRRGVRRHLRTGRHARPRARRTRPSTSRAR